MNHFLAGYFNAGYFEVNHLQGGGVGGPDPEPEIPLSVARGGFVSPRKRFVVELDGRVYSVTDPRLIRLFTQELSDEEVLVDTIAILKDEPDFSLDGLANLLELVVALLARLSDESFASEEEAKEAIAAQEARDYAIKFHMDVTRHQMDAELAATQRSVEHRKAMEQSAAADFDEYVQEQIDRTMDKFYTSTQAEYLKTALNKSLVQVNRARANQLASKLAKLVKEYNDEQDTMA